MKKNFILNFRQVVNSCMRIVLIFAILFYQGTHSSSAQGITVNNAVSSSLISGPFDPYNESDLDALPPVITYTPLASTCLTGGRVLTATITDADGVPTSGTGLPVLYWRINSGSYTAVTGVSIGSNQYNFTFGAGAVAGNLVSYYIVARDNVGNVIAKPSAGAGGYTTNPPAAATPPTSPDFYILQTTLATGTYNIGAGQVYVTITDAVNAYNNSCLNGPVIFILTDAAYDAAETFPITIGNPAASAANTLTIKPNTGINTTIQGSATDAIFKLNGSDYVTIDGSNSGGTTRNLTIINNSTNTASSVIWVGSASASNGATNNTIKNCNITGNATNTTYAALVSSSGVTAGTVAEAANTSNTYQNNSLTTSYYGMVVIGPVSGETGTVISNNVIGSTTTAKKLGYRGLLISNQTNVLVNNNSVYGVISSIGLGSDIEPTAGIVVSGAISGGNIYANNINDIRNTNVGGWPAYGISLQSTTAAAGIKVYDNFIYSILGYGSTSTPSNNGNGIAILQGGGYGIFFNSVHLYVSQPSAGGGTSSCLFIGQNVTGTASVDVRNNIFSNRRTIGTHYAIYCSVANVIFSSINYNDYYSAGLLGYLGSNRATIGAWQTATGSDGNSVSTNPIFVSAATPPIDLHLQPISPLNDQGITIPGVTTDIDGVTRGAAPDIGADEFTPPNCSGNSGGTAISDFSTVCTSGSVILSATGFSYGLGISYQWEKSTDNVTWGVVTGETNPTSSNPPTIIVTTWYRLRVSCSLTGGAYGYSNSVKITVYNPAILSKTDGSRCGPGTVNLAATGSPTTSIQWYITLTGGAPVYTGSPFTTPSLSATTTYYVESTYLGSSGTAGPLSPAAEGGTISTQLTSWDVTFNVIQATKLLTVDVYPLAAGEFSVIDIYNAAGTIIKSVPYTTTVSGGATAQTIDINASLTIGNGYYLYATNGLPPTGLTRNITNAVYPYNSTDIQITGNGFDPNFYMCYYRWRFTNGCSSDPRTAVTATVGASTAVNISASPASICLGQSSIVSASSTNTSYVYTWMPGSLPGASITVSPITTTTYTYTAVDGPCTSTGSVLVTVKPVPTNVVITPGPTVTKCGSAPAVTLNASGGNIAGIPILIENFNGAGNPVNWVIANTSTGTAAGITAADWTLRPDGYSFAGTSFHSNDNTQFYLSNSDANSATTRTTLRTPAFSLNGYTTASISFYQYFAVFGPPDSIAVEISQDGTTWTPASTHTVYSSHLSRGGSTSFSVVNASLDTWIGQATNYIRFRYTGNDGFQWAIDNVSITGGNGGSPISWTPVTGLYTNIAATAPYAYAGGPATTLYANPGTTTTYTATANPVNGCPKSDTVRVIIRGISALITSDVTNICPSGTANLSIALTGTGPWSLTYSDGVLPAVTVNNIATSPYTFTVNPLVTTTYTVTALSDAFCTAAPADLGAPVTVNVSVTANSTWLGINTNWMNPLNWCGGVPTSAKNVVIPSGPAFFPVITTTLPVGKDITIGSGASITINAGGKLSFTGNFVNNGTFTNYGDLLLNGSSAQTFPGGTTGIIAALTNVEVNNSAGATINKSITLTGTLKPTAGIITLNNVVITLHSDASGTASVAALGATAGFVYNTGKFSVERYISSGTKVGWRFLSAPIGGTQTINQAWQEGQLPGDSTSTGYGMQIIGSGGPALGFDLTTAAPSVKKYNPSTNTWVGIPNTTGPIATTEGYMCFIRGDRKANVFGDKSPTTLRMAGPVKTGPVGPLSTPTSNAFISVGNPYPSAIDFSTTSRVGLQNTYYLWDPSIGQYGAYRTFTGPGYTSTPAGYPGASKIIESGAAFFVVATAGAAPHNISFAETNKVQGSYQVQRAADDPRQLRTELSTVSGSETMLADGILVEFDPTYSNDIDDLDAPKMSNFGENLGISVGEKTLSVERHNKIVNNDTIFYKLGQLKQQQYQLEFAPHELAEPGLTAFLKDNYLQTTTALNLENTSQVLFTVDGNAASSASDRFYIFFKQVTVVPVTFTSIKAFPSDENIMVTWKVENELNINSYDVERSADGRNFIKIGTQAATGNGQGNQIQYSWLDKTPLTGDNFYRVKSIGNSGDFKYTEVVRVTIETAPSLITVSPNPVKNNTIGLNFIDQPKADYTLRLFSMSGQLVVSKNLSYPGGTQRIELFAGTELTPGVYNLEILMPVKMKRRRVYKVMVE